jgi:hypothetical protein
MEMMMARKILLVLFVVGSVQLGAMDVKQLKGDGRYALIEDKKQKKKDERQERKYDQQINPLKRSLDQQDQGNVISGVKRLKSSHDRLVD